MKTMTSVKSKQANKQAKKFWRFRAAADGKSADLLLYGPISDVSWLGDEVIPKQFAEDLAALGDIDVLNVYINSDGGDGFAGQAIHSQLKRFRAKAKVNVYIDGLAASAASLVAMAGETIYMPRNAMMMVHNAWMIAMGDVDDLRKAADMLERFYDTMIAVYREKTGLSEKEIRDIMNAETWMTAEEAVELGFADEIEEARSVAASLRGDGSILAIGGREVMEFDIGRFKQFPRERVSGGVTIMPAASAAGGGASGADGAARNKTDGSERRVTELELTVEILAKDHPAIYDAVKKAGHEEGRKAGYDEGLKAGRDEGVKAERARMQAIDAIATSGTEDLAKKAKYETGVSAEQLAVEILAAQKAKGANYLAAARADAQPLGDIKADPNAGDAGAAELEAVKAAFAKAANAKRGGDK